jgi:hypothetical protein
MAAARHWNAEAIVGLLDDPEWQKLPRSKLSKDRDEQMRLAGARILDKYIGMNEEQRTSEFPGMLQDMHEAPFDDQPRTRHPMP